MTEQGMSERQEELQASCPQQDPVPNLAEVPVATVPWLNVSVSISPSSVPLR